MAARAHYLAEFERVVARLPGLAAQRRSALERFAAAGFPTPAQETWKYTDLKPLEKQLFVAATERATTTGQVEEEHRVAGLDAYRLVFVDGHFVPRLSDFGGLPAGMTLAPLSQLMEKTDVADMIGAATDGAVTDLNGAFLTDG